MLCFLACLENYSLWRCIWKVWLNLKPVFKHGNPTMNTNQGWHQSLKTLTTFLLFLAIALGASRLINTWLGERALANTGLEYLSMEEALDLSQSTGKPVVAKFAAIWCGACRRIDNEVLVDERVKAALLKNFHYVRLEYNDDEQRRWFDQYGVQGFPQFLLIGENGQLIGRLRTPRTADDFVESLNQIASSTG